MKIPEHRGAIVLIAFLWFAASVAGGNADAAYLLAAMLMIFGVSALARCRNPAALVDKIADALSPVRFQLAGFVPVLLLFGGAAIFRQRADFR